MKVRTPDKALEDVMDNLSNRSAINAAIAGSQLLDEVDIPELTKDNRDHFDFLGFILSNDFKPKTHLDNNKNRIWPTIKDLFTAKELNMVGFSEQNCLVECNADGSFKGDLKTLKQAIIFWAVATALEFEYLKRAQSTTMELISKMPKDIQGEFMQQMNAKSSPLSAGHALHNKLVELINCTIKIEALEPAIGKMMTVISHPDNLAKNKYPCEIISILTNNMNLLPISDMIIILETLHQFVIKPTAEHAKACADIGKQLYFSEYNKKSGVETLTEKLFLLNYVYNLKPNEKVGLFKTRQK